MVTKDDKFWLRKFLFRVFLLMLLIIALFYTFYKTKSSIPVLNPATESFTPSESVIEIKVNKSKPSRIIVPKLDINAVFGEDLGLNSDNTIAVPKESEEVGWYKHSPIPGEFGPSIILGHVDSYLGPAIFYHLGTLEAGDDIYIYLEDGTERHFQVVNKERYEQEEFPIAEVYGDIDHAGLRLITCSGTYFRGLKRYSHNLVVYAKLVL
jgi:sortase (surface protein transpeptidase)